MARHKQDGTYLNVRIETPCYFIGIMSSEVIFNEQFSCFIV